MLLTNRRHRILFMALAAMEVAWFLPFALTLFIRMQPDAVALPALLLKSGEWAPLIFFALCWGTLLLYLLAADLLNRHQIDFPQRELTVIALIIVTFLLTTRLFLFPTLALGDFRWLGAVLSAIFDQGAGSAAVLFLLLLNLFLWLRVATATDRALTFFSVGVSFRLGMLLTLVGNALYILAAGQPVQQALIYLWLFFGFGLLAVALARVDEKAFHASQSSGATLPWSRLGQLLAMTAATVGLAIYASTLYTPTTIKTVLGWFSPLWNFLGAILLRLFLALFWLIGPLLERFINAIRAMLAGLEPLETPAQEFGEIGLAQNQLNFGEIVRDYTIVRYTLIALGLLVIFIVIAILFARTRQRDLANEAEQSGSEGLALGGNPFHRLRDLAGLFRRYGLRPGLLAAISVQNIYANVSRLAGRHGYPRAAAQPPDEYLPRLYAAFPGQEAALARLTAAYMRVHYGDQPVDETELTQLREDYTTIQETTHQRAS
jgi:hypothetical protein